MSIVEILDHNECIFDLKKRASPHVDYSISYQSKYRKKIVEDSKASKTGERRTFGYAEVPLAKPTEFLKKHQNKPVILPFKREAPLKCKERQPMRTRFPATNPDAPKKNFLRENILQVVHQVPPQPKKLEVFTRFGEKRRVEPVLVTETRYAKMPNFLDEFKPPPPPDIEGRYGDPCEGLQINSGPQFVSDVERKELLAGLKKNWDIKMKDYNLLPVITDTLRKIQNKIDLEVELKQLEKDIATIEKHPVLYVLDERREFRSA